MTNGAPRKKHYRIIRTTLALSALVLIGLAGPGLAQSVLPSPTDPVAAEQATVDALRLRAEQLQKTLSGDVCADPQTALKVLGDSSNPQKPLTPDSPPPPKSEKASNRASSENDVPALSRKELVDRLHKGVALILADRDSGSGFFITPSIVITNSHVVSSASKGEVIVASKGLSHPMVARVIASTGAKEQGGRDYAVLQIEGGQSSTTLPLTLETSELTPVVAAGFPGLLLDTDMNFRALIQGDVSAMPELGMSQGAVMALQNRSQQQPVIVHSAPISGGNSGGPLVDSCGRVVGINTFINVSVEQASSAGFAQASSDLVAYLKGLGIQPQVTSSGCANN